VESRRAARREKSLVNREVGYAATGKKRSQRSISCKNSSGKNIGRIRSERTKDPMVKAGRGPKGKRFKSPKIRTHCRRSGTDESRSQANKGTVKRGKDRKKHKKERRSCGGRVNLSTGTERGDFRTSKKPGVISKSGVRASKGNGAKALDQTAAMFEDTWRQRQNALPFSGLCRGC